jgi:translation initiation factor IF-3
VPVPRRFDRRPPERDSTRINDRIRVPEVRLVGEDGKQIGVIKTTEALAYAQERDLDLVEVAADARPPVCRVLDYSKYKYEQEQKQKAARKHQQQINIREIKFRPKIAQNDYDTKKGHVRRFLKGKDKVKVTIMFRGREVTHPERGVALLTRLAEELTDVGTVEQSPLQDGRNMTMMLGPSKAVLAGELEGEDAAGEAAAAGDAAVGDVAASDAPAGDAVAADDSVAAEAPVDDAAVSEAADSDAAAGAADAAPAAATEVKADSAAKGTNGHHNGDAAKAPSPAASDAPA